MKATSSKSLERIELYATLLDHCGPFEKRAIVSLDSSKGHQMRKSTHGWRKAFMFFTYAQCSVLMCTPVRPVLPPTQQSTNRVGSRLSCDALGSDKIGAVCSIEQQETSENAKRGSERIFIWTMCIDQNRPRATKFVNFYGRFAKMMGEKAVTLPRNENKM